MAETVDWMGLSALIIAAVALLVSVAAALFTKVQADAAVGDLPPDFEMSGQRSTSGSMARGLNIDVWNHNRQTIHIQSFNFSAPKGLLIMHKPRPGGSFDKPKRKVVLKYEMPVKSLDRSNNTPVRFQFAHSAAKGSEPPAMFFIHCRIRYRVGGSHFPRWGDCNLQVER